MRISWDEALNVMERAIRRGMVRKKDIPALYLGTDENAFCKGQDYMSLVCDLLVGRVEFVVWDSKAESLGVYYRQFTAQQLKRIYAVDMVMWDRT